MERVVKVSEYLEKWIPVLYAVEPGQRGFRSRCIEELSTITGTPGPTIDRNWGSAPDFERAPSYLELFLTLQDAVNTGYEIRLQQQERGAQE